MCCGKIIARVGFENGIVEACACKNYVEDLSNMYLQHPFYDEYWKSKTPDWSKIRVPAYVCGGMCHFHLRGSVVGFRKIRSPKKWLRLHRDMEWPDTYNPDNLEDLRKFYDRYLKGIRNGWEFTPKVRVDVMDAYNFDYIKNKPEKEFPIARTQYTKLYLNSDGTMGKEIPVTASEVVYDNKTGMASFGIKFEEETEYKREALNNLIKLLINDIRGAYKNISQYNIILSGGGAKVANPTFIKKYPQTKAIEDIKANAKGFRKVGIAKWQKR